MSLKAYRSKRKLAISKEPPATQKKTKSNQLIFVVQEHHARQLHYDLRLEVKGVLKSWAVPKKPSMNSKIKRLAIMVEDHPYGYKDFEGVIEEGYGKGTVSIWDSGTYDVDGQEPKETEKQILSGIKKGSFSFSLHGKKLRGSFALVKLKNSDKNEWLLIKKQKTRPDASR